MMKLNRVRSTAAIRAACLGASLAALGSMLAIPAFSAPLGRERPPHSATLRSAGSLGSRRLDLEPAAASHWIDGPRRGALAVSSAPSVNPKLDPAVKLSWATPRVEALARNFHRQGLPIVHLWENSQSLVTLGLNRKGVPGLYVLQKME